MNKRNKKGISLIVLEIMIIIMVIITSTVIISIRENNPMQEAELSVDRNNMLVYREEYNAYLALKYKVDPHYDIKQINATAKPHGEDEFIEEYPNDDLNKYIPSYDAYLYEDLLEIKEGKIYFDKDIAEKFKIYDFVKKMFIEKTNTP